MTNYCKILILLASIYSCNGTTTPTECEMYILEEYTDRMVEDTLAKEAYAYESVLLDKFGENSIKNLDHEAYHLQFYSSHGFGKSIKFERGADFIMLSVKCDGPTEWNNDCKEYKISIESEEWRRLEAMIYEFNFWTAEKFRTNSDVLDGYAFLLRGNRPIAAKCNKKSVNLIVRGSPRYDKMGALCDNIVKYEDQIRFKYEQLKKIQ